MARLQDRLLRRLLPIRLHTKFEHREQWVRHLICGEEDVLRLDELVAEKVCEGMIFLVESEQGGVWYAS